MHLTKIKIFALVGFLVVFSFLAIRPAQAVQLPCTPSSGAEAQNDVFNCVDRLYRFGLVAATIAAVFMIILAGYLYIFSGGSESRVGTAKSFISTSLIGLAVLVVGYLILQQINPEILEVKNISPDQIGSVKLNDYNEQFEDTNTTPISNTPVTAPSGDAQSIAKQLLQAVGPSCFLSRQVSGVNDGASARDNITATANGQPAKRSSYGNAPGGSINLDSRMLGALLAIHNQGYNICPVTALAGGSHSKNSAHYRGTALDIDVVAGEKMSTINARVEICKQLGAKIAQYESDTTHIHCQW